MRRRPRATLAWGLGIESLLLVGFAVLTWTGAPFRDPNAPAAIAALLFGMTAMGVQSALVRLLMRGVASTNVMTTNTTLLATSAAEILLGWIECRKSGSAATYVQAHREFFALFPLGVGFFGGTAIGAIAFIILGLPCISAAIIPVGGLALWYARNSD
jgi:hypothetical protein